ncbi:MAG: type II toxin-antitoxin system RelE/ParE family toxin [Gemmatimonadota bacterium]
MTEPENTFTVQFTPAALEDLEEILDYVAEDSPLRSVQALWLISDVGGRRGLCRENFVTEHAPRAG